jgi:serine/threonine protein phosphatase PrpC
MIEFPLQTVSISSCGAKEQIIQKNENNRYLISSITDKGKDKNENQDSLLIKYGETSLGHCVLLAVADGVGGLYRGDQASKAVIDKLCQWWDVTLKNIAYRPACNASYLIHESLSAAISSINLEIYESSSKSGKKMGTTLTLLFLLDSWYCVKHAGDSRVYVLSRYLKQLTEDDNLLNQYLKSGTNNEAIEDYKQLSNTITNCVGVKQDMELFEQSGRFSEKDRFILCTDGLYKHISFVEIHKCMQKCCDDIERTQFHLQQLIDKARKRGEKDDITAIVISGNKNHTGLWHKMMELRKGW